MSGLLDEGVTRNILVDAIHEAPVACVLELAGAGTQVLGWLHGVSGSSSTVLEAHDRYHFDSMAGVLGKRPERSTDPTVADALAAAAFKRARELSGDGVAVIGLGCTAALVTNRSRRGAHVCHVTTYDGLGSCQLTVNLTKGARVRGQEEQVAASLVLFALAISTGVDWRLIPKWPSPEQVSIDLDASPDLVHLLSGSTQVILRSIDGHVLVDPTAMHRSEAEALLSGSFNPLHDGHHGLAAAASEYLGMEVAYELPVLNADKLPLSVMTTHRRAGQFLGRANLWLTRAALYTEKARLFPGTVFVVGADTACRVLQPRFYGGKSQMIAAVEAICDVGCRFLVAARSISDGLLTLKKIDVPERFKSSFIELPAEKFCLDRSSTEIRTTLTTDTAGSIF